MCSIRNLIQRETSFVLGKLNKNPSEFFVARERFLLQGVMGIDDELFEVSEETDEIKALGELGDVLFYVILTYHGIEKFSKLDDVRYLFDESIASGEVVDNALPKMKGLCKKICFQERHDLVNEFIVVFSSFVKLLAEEYTYEGLELAISLMKYKLTKRYGNAFSKEKSKNREV